MRANSREPVCGRVVMLLSVGAGWVAVVGFAAPAYAERAGWSFGGASSGHRHVFRPGWGGGGLPMCDCGAMGSGGGGGPGSGLPLPGAELLVEVPGNSGSGSGGSSGPPGGGVAASGLTVPSWSSRPQATAKLYLKFDGIAYEGNWGNTGRAPGVVPAYSVDSDTSSFSATELNNLFEIWSRVAEAFSPFDLDVTTVDPGTPSSRGAVRVIVGGSNAWYSSSAGGVAYIGGFTYADYHFGTAWVFPANLGNGNPKFVSDAAIHEAGHLFGLYHQQHRGSDGSLISAYRDFENDPVTAPIMGLAYNRPRGVWSGGVVGFSSGQFVLQDDLRQIASTSSATYNHPFLGSSYWNGFGYRADDHGNTATGATVLVESVLAGSTPAAGPGVRVLSATGVIERAGDVDVFRFDSPLGGEVRVLAENATFGAMLDVRLQIWSSDLSLLAEVNPPIQTGGPDFGLDASWSGWLSAGTYYVGVSGAGGYGDLGQYTLTVLLGAALVPEPAAGAGLVWAGVLLLLRRRCRGGVGVKMSGYGRGAGAGAACGGNELRRGDGVGV